MSWGIQIQIQIRIQADFHNLVAAKRIFSYFLSIPPLLHGLWNPACVKNLDRASFSLLLGDAMVTVTIALRKRRLVECVEGVDMLAWNRFAATTPRNETNMHNCKSHLIK